MPTCLPLGAGRSTPASIMTDISPDTPRPEDRIDALEMRIAHQDQTIEDLNAAVTAQWKLIDRLERQVALRREQAEAAASSTGAAPPADKPPPHY